MLPIIYWLPKMHKIPFGARVIVASKNCSTKPLSDAIFKNFKWIFNTVESFYNKSFFYLGCNKFLLVQNSFPVVIKLNKINDKKRDKSILPFNFSTLYTIIPHKFFLKVLSEVINFIFKSKVRKRIGISKTSL